MKKKSGFPVGRAILCGVLALFIIAANVAVNFFAGYFDNMYTVYEAEASEVNHVSYEEAMAHGQQVTADILREGSVLLKNENNTLPLANTTKVNLFGWRSTKMVFGGAGSGFVDDTTALSLEDALKEQGIEANPALLKLYTDYSTAANSSGVGATDFTITELPKDKYTDIVLADAKAYSDVAIVTISRMGGEGNDLPQDMAAFGGEAGRHYLELSKAEEDMIELVKANFGTVILLVNSSHAMELGFTQDAGIDAVLWVGCPGTTGLRGVVDVLLGKANPSGRLVDTYAYDFTKAPSFPNFGDFAYTNAPDFFYTNYMEGIYVGYRYYETRGFTDGEEWYKNEVLFPFGYGLSYTTFEQKLASFENKDGVITATVEVKNTGSVAGKDVVQLYYTAPYTPGGIEKSHVVLAAFGKTKVIEPGAADTVTLSFKVEDMASYDYISSGAYVLDAGKYEVKLMKNAHEVIASETVEVPSTIVYGESNKRSSDLAAAVNRFDDANVRFTEGHSYLSRNDWEGTWPKAEYAVSSLSDSDLAYLKGAMSAGYQIAGDPNLSAFADTAIVTEKALTASDIENVRAALKDALADNEEAIAELAGVESGTVDLSSMTTLQSSYQKLLDGKLVFALMTYFDYESPVWNTLLDQLSLADLSDVVTMGGYRTAPIDAIEKSVTMDIDGPAGMQPFLGFGIDIQPGVGYATEVTLASTWNVELAEEMGVCVGEFANTQNVSGWYAPAMNGHRSPFAGRNFEYYSEDPCLAGKFAAAATRGARSQGIWVYLKHFALNDQELHRDQNGILTFSNEQAIRELYCKPFEIAVKEGEATGVMSAFNRIGLVWAGGSRALCTDVLRSEWGFKGTVITDFYMNWGSTYMNAMEGVLAGNDLYLNPFQGEAVTVQAMQGSNQLAQAARQSVKNILYMTSRGEIVSFHVVSSWRPLWIVGNVVCGVLLAMAAVWLVRGIVKKKEK